MEKAESYQTMRAGLLRCRNELQTVAGAERLDIAENGKLCDSDIESDCDTESIKCRSYLVGEINTYKIN